jgi:hypothetical protein
LDPHGFGAAQCILEGVPMAISNAEVDGAHRPLQPGKLETYWAWTTLANGALGLIVAVGVAMIRGSEPELSHTPPIASLLGVLAGALTVRGKIAGLIVGLFFYGLQVLSYYSSSIQFNFRSGFSLAKVVELSQGVLVINLAALAGLVIAVWLLARHLRSGASLLSRN